MKETEDRLEKAAKQKETKQKTNLRKGTQGKLAGANSSLGSRLAILLGILGLLILCSLSVPIVTMGSKAGSYQRENRKNFRSGTNFICQYDGIHQLCLGTG